MKKPKTYLVRKQPVYVRARQAKVEELIETLEGSMLANPGDFIITGINGEEYPCKPDIFFKTYQPGDAECDQVWHKHWFVELKLRA